MLALLKLIATLAASIFAGAALYINLVEHPARMTLDTRSAAMEWAPSYARATWMQAHRRGDSVHTHRHHADQQSDTDIRP